MLCRTMESVQGEKGPGKTPGSEEGFSPTLQPVEARSDEVIERLAQERKQGHGCRIGMRSQRRPVDNAVACVPAASRADSVVQHFHAAPHTKLQQILLRTSMDLS